MVWVDKLDDNEGNWNKRHTSSVVLKNICFLKLTLLKHLHEDVYNKIDNITKCCYSFSAVSKNKAVHNE